MSLRFPSAFLFGVATSSYQIEGAEFEGGASPSVWSMFSRLNGTIQDGTTGLVACDHYHKFEEDVALMADMGMKAYRFSLSWARIWPDTSGVPNPEGVAFYRNLLTALRAADIQPVITLYHWDLPLYLHEKGGWTNPESAEWFADYAERTVALFEDLCNDFITLNEPWVFMHKGYITGEHAPGEADLLAGGWVYINTLQAHRLAMSRLRDRFPTITLSVAVNLAHIISDSESMEDRAAAERQRAYINDLFVLPWFLGRIPDVAYLLFPERSTDLDALNGLKPIRHDMICVNYYSRSIVKHRDGGFLDSEFATPRDAVTAMNWEISPDGFKQILLWTYEMARCPIWVTENGSAWHDEVVNGEIHDIGRCDYLNSHLDAMRESIDAGADVQAYFAWSLLDNYEWECGYRQRFGLVHVDFDTQKRTIKQSGRLYSEVVRSHEPLLDRI
jgi:beta-glucosidase